MSNNLYDTGAPKRIIVEHQHTHEVTVRRPEASWCTVKPGEQCIGGPHDFGELCKVCPYRSRDSVTITHEFIDPPPERKRLK